MTIKKEIIIHEGRTYRATLNYDLGGPNYFTGGHNKRGYSVHVSPVKIHDGFESQMLGAGYKRTVVECTRQTPRRQAEAIEKYEATVKELLPKVAAEWSQHAGLAEQTETAA
jgi:hypothetical protein